MRRLFLCLSLAACGPTYEQPRDVSADRPHAHSSGASAVAFDEDAGPPPVTASAARPLPEILDKKLSNGVRVLMMPRHDLPIVKLSVVLKRGATEAPPGFAHLWISAATTATREMSRVELNAWFRRRGAATSRDAAYTHSTFDVKVVTPLLDPALEVVAEAVLRGRIDEETVKRATSDHANAVLGARSNPSTIAYRTFVRSLYPTGHPYGETVIGEDAHPTVAEVESFERATVTAGDLALVVAGDFDPEHVLAKLDALFGKLGGTSPAPRAIDDIAPRARRGVMVARAHDPQVQLAIGFAGVERSHADHAALHVASVALRDATLHDIRLVEGATYTTSVFEAVRRGPAPIVVQTAVDPTRVASALQDIWHAMDKLRSGIPEADLAHFRERAVVLYPSRFDTLASAVANLVDIAAMDLPVSSFANELDALTKVTAADVKRVAEKYMTDQTVQAVIVGEPLAIRPAQDLLEYHPAAN